MKTRIFLMTILVTCFAVCLAFVAGLAGKWKSSAKGPDGSEHQFHLVLQIVNGDKLLGTAQGGGEPVTINDGKIAGDNFTFNIKDPHDGTVISMDGKYFAVGDSISLNFIERDDKHHLTFVRDNQ